MATVKKANVPPTHPTVYAGLALASVGLLVAIWAYTGTRVYEIVYAVVAAIGGVLALAGILVAAWGRSIMAARSSRSRRATIAQDALAVGKPASITQAATESLGSETMPTVAAPSEKKRFSFPIPKRTKKEDKPVEAAALFAFKRKPVEAQPAERAPDDPRHPVVAERLAEERPPTPSAEAPAPVRATLKCPQCGHTFSAEGVRPFEARCSSCGFASTV